MNLRRIFSLRNSIIYISWFFWFVFLANSLTFFSTPFLKHSEKIQNADHLKLLFIILVGVAIIESGVTILIRYFAIIRPFRRGTYNPYQRPFRFLIVGLINWIFS